MTDEYGNEVDNTAEIDVLNTLMDLDIDNAQALATLPSGSRVVARIVKAEPNIEKHYIRLELEVSQREDGEACNLLRNFSHFLYLPKPDDSDKKKNNKLFGIKCFCECFKISPKPSSLSDWEGASAWVILAKNTDERMGDFNEIARDGLLKQ